jgi:hypothetical protein
MLALSQKEDLSTNYPSDKDNIADNYPSDKDNYRACLGAGPHAPAHICQGDQGE